MKWEFLWFILLGILPLEEKVSLEKIVEKKLNEESGKVFYKDDYQNYSLGWREKKLDIGNGIYWYIEAVYDFNRDSVYDAVAYFKILAYDFEKNIPISNSKASKIILDEDFDGEPDKYHFDRNQDGVLEEFHNLDTKKKRILIS